MNFVMLANKSSDIIQFDALLHAINRLTTYSVIQYSPNFSKLVIWLDLIRFHFYRKVVGLYKYHFEYSFLTLWKQTFVVIVPSPSLSKRTNASLNSAICSSVNSSLIWVPFLALLLVILANLKKRFNEVWTPCSCYAKMAWIYKIILVMVIDITIFV